MHIPNIALLVLIHLVFNSPSFPDQLNAHILQLILRESLDVRLSAFWSHRLKLTYPVISLMKD